jgi:hypothetical protein
MTVARAMLVARDIRAIEAALVKLERELESTEGDRRVILEGWVAETHRGLERVARLLL